MVTPPRLLQQGPAQRHIVLDHADNEINESRGGVTTVDGGRKRARIVLLAGAGTCSTPKKLLARADLCSRSHSDHGKNFRLFH